MITQATKELIIMHLVRDARTIRNSELRLPPDLFSGPNELPFMALWMFSLEHFQLEQKPISKLMLEFRMKQFFELYPDEIGHIDYVEKLIELSFSVGVEDLSFDAIKPDLQAFIDERRVLPQLQAFQGDNTAEAFDELQVTVTQSRLTSSEEVDVMNLSKPEYDQAPSKPTPTGCKCFDILTDGGFRPNHLTGVLAAFEAGKTQIAIDTSVSIAMQKQHAYLFQYELDVELEMRPRVYSRITGIPTPEFSNKPVSEYSPQALDSLKEYSYLSEYLHLYDMQQANQGFGGADEIANLIEERLAKNPDHTPAFIAVDWMGLLATRYITGNGLKIENKTAVIVDQMDKFKRLCGKYNCEIMITHQLNAAAGSRDSSHRPSVYDAADCKSFAAMQNTCIIICRRDSNDVALMCNDKNRGTHTDIWVRMQGHLCRAEVLEGEFQSIPAGGNTGPVWDRA